jgi:hypothetical protein
VFGVLYDIIHKVECMSDVMDRLVNAISKQSLSITDLSNRRIPIFQRAPAPFFYWYF